MVIIRYFILSVLFFQFSYSQKVNWITIEKAQELQKKVPKNIIMDVYTNWCGPCKLMDKYTFQNPDVANYLNDNFYSVKFNAEGDEKVIFKGRNFKNNNYKKSLSNTRNSTHDFARYLGISGYPTIVFFDINSNPIAPITGYLNPNQIEIYLNLFSNDAYTEIKSQEDFKKFIENFESQFKI
jgi:thioredoxin-related protein